MLIYQEKIIETDKEGYLVNVDDWTPEIAELIAGKEDIILTQAHWSVINFVRNFYHDYNTSPAIRLLVKLLKEAFGEKIGNSIYLQRLFPKGPAKQACKIAGLPKPIKCL
ncbi:TusE/DsrC/DsvC family sulfur relay protein [Thorsellia anophelis]|uniref:Sulfurtransferase n=1 Tax=Thorsellia anophelis DSM 18579 TaxID=1123402 RepID=A0A1I0F1Y8_9GAMM|nr:TusE/DsrC/DsvC family sulfur relay protein [Thorsellia anophelis]SET51810.1 tRNA 2-thiouridine synthesizing protein E [Thorsellia anophelis DSM 18579]